MLFFVAPVTPFDAQGRVDLARLRAHVLWLAAQGVDGFVPTADTGEFLYLADREREAIHRTVLDAARGLPVYPCPWDPSPKTMAYLCDAAREQGATGFLIPPPLLYPLADDDLEGWYQESAAAAKLPVFSWNAPGLFPSTIASPLYMRLREQGVLAGMIDQSQDNFRLQRLAAIDPGAVYASGDRVLSTAPKIASLGGFVSSLANVWPNFCVRVFKQREVQLDEALAERVSMVARAGGVRALKAMLGMGCRSPLPAPPREALEPLPPRERP